MTLWLGRRALLRKTQRTCYSIHYVQYFIIKPVKNTAHTDAL